MGLLNSLIDPMRTEFVYALLIPNLLGLLVTEAK